MKMLYSEAGQESLRFFGLASSFSFVLNWRLGLHLSTPFRRGSSCLIAAPYLAGASGGIANPDNLQQ